MKQVVNVARQVALTDSLVLIDGETGAGKEVIEELIHRKSQRSGQPFSNLNCAVLSDNLLGSELFGHEKGGFTGATESRPGLFEVADGVPCSLMRSATSL
ncbi:MAG: sigma 54-interacting transcriptional regulator [Planctomycetota bacterium]|jgi:two-component system response regulator FlrC|nr:sigma 54-interacting transcriptional regulator [Planctomycetota bacterium]